MMSCALDPVDFLNPSLHPSTPSQSHTIGQRPRFSCSHSHQGSIGLMRGGRGQPEGVKTTGNHQIRPGMRATLHVDPPTTKPAFPALVWMNASVMHKSGHASRTLNLSSHASANHFIARKLLLPTLSPCAKRTITAKRAKGPVCLKKTGDIKILFLSPTVRRDQLGSV